MFHLVAAIAWRQHGAFTFEQALAAGASSSWLGRAAEAGTIERRRLGVYAIAGTPRTVAQQLMVEVLGGGRGALATGDSALALWCPELDAPRQPVVAVARRGGRRTSRTCRLIRSSDLHLANPGVLDGVPVVGVARALLDASIGRDHDPIVARINACQRHLPMSFGALVDVLHTHAQRGRPGIATFRRALGAMSREVPDSEFERLVLRDLASVDVESPVLHHVVRPPGERAIELDVAWPSVRLDVELDGRDHMARMKTARRDRERDRILTRMGWGVVRFVWDDYLDRAVSLVDEIVDTVRARTSTISVV